MHSFLIGLQFLTRLRLVNQTAWTAEDFGHSVKFFPLIGLIIGLVLAAVYLLLQSYLPVHVMAAVLVIAELLVTGGLHGDGFMDTADGVFSGRSRERMLEIMKDSRVGANGVMAFGALMLLKWTLFLDMPRASLLDALIIMPMIGRLAMVMGVTCFPYARPEGIGKAFAQYANKHTLYFASGLTLVAIVVMGRVTTYAALCAMGLAILFARYITCIIGGLTGDVYGAINELTELCVLFMFMLLH
jgi:adenosylcobinamide-GDP ribazoletransferase